MLPEPNHSLPTPIFYLKPGHLFTKKDAALANMRTVGEKAAHWHVLTEYPTHYCRSSRPVAPEAISELRAALQSVRVPTEKQLRRLGEAWRAGQVVVANLYPAPALQSFDIKPPKLHEAAAYLQAHFEDGSLRSWITEYYHRGKGKKALWTVGDEIHADDQRYLDFDLWKNHFKAKSRDLYKPQGVRHLARCRYTRWVALDVDNHADEPSPSREEWVARYTALHALLQAEKLLYLAQVNPKNGSYQLWSPVNKWPLGKVAAFPANGRRLKLTALHPFAILRWRQVPSFLLHISNRRFCPTPDCLTAGDHSYP